MIRKKYGSKSDESKTSPPNMGGMFPEQQGTPSPRNRHGKKGVLVGIAPMRRSGEVVTSPGRGAPHSAIYVASP